MIANGKRRRRETGLDRHELHRASHTPKGPDKIRRACWIRDPKQSTNSRRGA